MAEFFRDNAVGCATALFFIIVFVWVVIPFRNMGLAVFCFRVAMALMAAVVSYDVAIWGL